MMTAPRRDARVSASEQTGKVTRRAWLGALCATGWAPSWHWAHAADGPPDVLLAEQWRPGQSPCHHLVSEKLDGVRAYWDGQALRTRSGHVIAAPDWFTQALPAHQALDGELWMGRQRFDALSAAVRRQRPHDVEWQQIRYMLFELPQGQGTFAARYEQLQTWVQHIHRPFVNCVAQRRVADAAALDAWLEDVMANGGEGLMLHHASAAYLTGRQAVLAKYKPVQDGEAVVLEHVSGHGRLSGRTGALVVRNAQGQVFRVGSGLSDELRARPPAIGSTITYTWRGQTRTGLPRFATFLRERPPGV
jgi:DNA ligase 1